MSQPTGTCKNCEKVIHESYQFCPYCGQKAKDDLTLGVLFYNTIANYFSFDARFFKSFLPLIFRPGYLAQKFIEGKRMLYLHPAQLYLFISVIFFFLFSFNVRQQVNAVDKSIAESLKDDEEDEKTNALFTEVQRDSIKQVKAAQKRKRDSIEIETARKALKDNKKWTGMTDAQIDSIVHTDQVRNSRNGINFSGFGDKVEALIKAGAEDEVIYREMGLEEDAGFFKRKLYAQALKLYKTKSGGSLVQSFYDTIPIAMFFLLPIFAFILKLFYYKSGRYAHHLVFSFYYFSFLFTVFALLLAANRFFNVSILLTVLLILSTFIYLYISIIRFYRKNWFTALVKTGMITFIFMLIVIPITAGFVAVIAFLFY